MKCNLEFNFQGEPEKLVQELKKAVIENNGVYKGDNQIGECYGKSPIEYHLEYSFVERPNFLTIKILTKPFNLSWSTY